MKTKVIVIVGPTASGKTAAAIEIAKKVHGEIICADSRTVYRGMDTGTAKPACAGPERQRGIFIVDGVPHWGIDLVDPNEEYNVGMFQEYARAKIEEIVARGHVPILVGGTGLFVDTVIDNLTLPNVEPDSKLRTELEKKSADDLYSEYERLDPIGAARIDRNNKRRLIRALEVCKKTGTPFSSLRKKGESMYDAIWIGMKPLRLPIDARVDQMISAGLVDEVQRLKDRYGCDIPSMSGIGYQEICRYLDQEVSLEQAIADIKKHTRQFAKRQMTWLRRRKEIVWCSSVSEAAAVACL